MKKIFFLALLFTTQIVFAQQEKYSRVKVLLAESGKTVKDLQTLGIAVDHGEYNKGISFTSDFSATEIKTLQQAGFKTDILIDDVQQYYVAQNQKTDKPAKKKSMGGCVVAGIKTPIKPQHFHLGSYGGYFTYQELLNQLDSMRLLYPNLISAKQAIDTFHTIQGRPIYWLRISNHPDSNQAKPQMVYTALHHAREPASISQLVYYLWYMLENYAIDAQVQAVVDNAELYFVPCLNPDGYLYNQTNSPLGGGMWRKNLRDNLDGTFGVDLNRNYGFNWGYDNVGSSNQTNSDTYRGTAAFSEPETQAIKWFIEQHDFLINLNYHTYSNDIIYPWGYIASFKTPDSTQFDSYAAFLTRFNGYKYGTGDQTVGYVTNGDSDDWGYGEQTSKNKIFSFTPEVGPAASGFYPPSSDIEGLCADNLFANLNAAKLILQYAVVKNTGSLLTSNFNNQCYFNLQRLGMANGATFTVSIAPLDNWISHVGAAKVFSNFNLLQSANDSIAFTLNAAISNGQVFRYLLTVNNGRYNESDTITMRYTDYPAKSIANRDSINNWITTGGTWGTTTATYVSAPNSITDSPIGNYADNTTNTITLANSIDLTNAHSPVLSFYCKWQIEKDYDYVVVEAYTTQSGQWTPLCGIYTHDGSANQLQGEPIYDGDNLSAWVKEQMPLDNFINQKIKIRFTLVADGGVNYDGFYFDDLKFEGLDTTSNTNSGLMNINSHDAFTIYPNPTTNQSLVISQSPLVNATVKLINLTGQTIIEKQHQSGNQFTLDLSAQPQGIYFIEVQQGGEVVRRGKLVKE